MKLWISLQCISYCMIVIRASPTDDSDIVSNGSTTKKTTKVQPVSEPGQCDESMPKNTGLSWVGPFFNVNPWKGKDHEVKFFGLFHGLRSERIINYDDALQDAENNEFYFDTEGNLHPDMVNKLRRIAKNHKIYLIVHGWTDSIESLHRIYGVEWPIAIAADWRFYGHGHVFIVDWSIHAKTSYLLTASVSKIVEVARVIHQFLEIIRELNGADAKRFYKQVHGAGHSLGAHILGKLGHDIIQLHAVQLGILYGLDPSGLGFHVRLWDDGSYFRIDHRSAEKVLILHTAYISQQLSLRYAIGHYDYYAFVREGVKDRCADDTSCLHQRCTNLFKAAMELHNHIDEQLVGFKCDGSDRVGSQITSQFGIHHDSNDVQGVYYVPIGECSPYNEIKGKRGINMKKCRFVQASNAIMVTTGTIRTYGKDVLFESEKLVNKN